MRTMITAIVVLAIAASAAAQAPPAKGGDDAAIRQVVKQQDEFRNRGEWKALGALFTSDAEQMTSAGEWRRGRAEIEKGVAQTMGTAYKGATYTSKVDAVRFLSPAVAIADGPFEISGIAGAGVRRGHTTTVLVKSGAAWHIAATRSMVPAAVGPTPAR